jgi:N-acetylglucosamine-6-sulfatase
LLTGTALVLAVAGLASLLLSGGCLPQEPSTDKPNIVLILTDDQDARSLDYMPRVKAQLIDRGTTFDNGFVTDPLCCPSRATILRGQYVHNHTIRGNTAPNAHDRFRDLGLEESTVAMWLHEGGYRTALIGKYPRALASPTPTPGMSCLTYAAVATPKNLGREGCPWA